MRKPLDFGSVKRIKTHPHQWLWEPLESDHGFALKSMFGGKAVYLDGKLALFFAAKEEPWLGMMACTCREHHASLMKEFPTLKPHPILPKWLYLPEAEEHFEKTAQALVSLAKKRDPRLGV
jgi:hypothetical protein